jgi:hypothetical protein
MTPTILQLNPIIEFFNPEFGQVWALFIYDYGLDQNSIFLCRITNTGKLKHFNTNQLLAPKNYTIEP